jgi:hypothetical protein
LSRGRLPQSRVSGNPWRQAFSRSDAKDCIGNRFIIPIKKVAALQNDGTHAGRAYLFAQWIFLFLSINAEGLPFL